MDPTTKWLVRITCLVLLGGVIDRENKSELKKLREVVERMEGEPSGIIDI